MTESELRVAFDAQRAALHAWGKLVSDTIVAGLHAALGTRPVDEFLKVPPKPRVKSVDSFVAKALFRGKVYSDPMTQITDKVGVRFVTLLVNEIPVVCKVVEACSLWRFELARDFESEKRLRPNQFDYQSQHYIVYARTERVQDGVNIPADLPCEVQVRTLLQHAFAELSHDTTYKTKLAVDPVVKREVAKTSALIETTDAIFESVSKTISEADYALRCVQGLLLALYEELVGGAVAGDTSAGIIVLDSFRNFLPELTESELRGLFLEKPFLLDRIKQRCKNGEEWFSQPVILAVYHLVRRHPSEVAKGWPLYMDFLKPIYTDLGISLLGIW